MSKESEVILYHGTSSKNIPFIKEHGLIGIVVQSYPGFSGNLTDNSNTAAKFSLDAVFWSGGCPVVIQVELDRSEVVEHGLIGGSYGGGRGFSIKGEIPPDQLPGEYLNCLGWTLQKAKDAAKMGYSFYRVPPERIKNSI